MGVYVECYFPNSHGTRVDTVLTALNAAQPRAGADVWRWDVPATSESIADGTCALIGPPGLLWISIHILSTRASVRWRWFLQNPEALRDTLSSLRSLGRTLLAHSMIIVPDWASESLLEPTDVTFGEVLSRLQTEWGPSQSFDAVAPEVVAEAERSSPRVWFHETLR